MLGGGLARKLARKAVAAAVAAGAALVAVIAFGATIFYALCLVVVPLAAAALTVVMVLLRREAGEEEIEDDEPAGLGERAYTLFRNRPILGTVAALAGGWIFLRNPALATMVAAAFTEKPHGRRRR